MYHFPQALYQRRKNVSRVELEGTEVLLAVLCALRSSPQAGPSTRCMSASSAPLRSVSSRICPFE